MGLSHGFSKVFQCVFICLQGLGGFLGPARYVCTGGDDQHVRMFPLYPEDSRIVWLWAIGMESS